MSRLHDVWVWVLEWAPYALPAVANAVLVFLGVWLSLPDFAQKVQDNPTYRKLLAALCIGLGLIGFVADVRARHDSDRTSAKLLSQVGTALTKTNELLTQTGSLVTTSQALLKTQQESFARTLSAIVGAQRKEEQEFSALLRKEDDLFTHQEQLTESLNGKLLPAADPTPSNNCSTIPPSSILVKLGDESQRNAAVIGGFPATVFENGISSIVIDRDASGLAIVSLDIRSNDKKIIARLNKDGFVVNRNNYLEMKRDRSTLQIIDEYGVEVLYVRYLNQQALAIRGTLRLPDNSEMAIGLPKNFTGVCASGIRPGGIAYQVRRP